MTNSGDWIIHKWHGKRRGFLKIPVGVDVETKQILAVKITDQHSHDSKHLKYIVSESAKYGTITKALCDGAFDFRESFSFLDDRDIIPAIKVRKNSVPKSRGCHPRKIAVMKQLADYKRWCASEAMEEDGL